MRKGNPLKVIRHVETRPQLHKYIIHEDGREYGVVYVTDPNNIVAESRLRKGLQCKRA